MPAAEGAVLAASTSRGGWTSFCFKRRLTHVIESIVFYRSVLTPDGSSRSMRYEIAYLRRSLTGTAQLAISISLPSYRRRSGKQYILKDTRRAFGNSTKPHGFERRSPRL